MAGVSNLTGKFIDDIEHVKQSISEIIKTPIGTRLMRRDFGSDLYDYIDKPMNNDTKIGVFFATAQAIDKFEKRVKLSRILASFESNGHLTVGVDFEYLHNDGSKEKSILRDVIV